MNLWRDARDLAYAIGSVLVGTVLELHAVFVERDECGAVSDFHDGTVTEIGDQIVCDLPVGHRGGHQSRRHNLDVDEFSSWSDHGYDGPRCIR